MNVPGLVDKMDSSKAGRKAVLGGKRETHSDQHASQVSRGPSRTASWRACCFSGIEISANGGRERKHTYLPFVKVPSVPSCLCSPATPQLSCIRPVTSESQLCDHWHCTGTFALDGEGAGILRGIREPRLQFSRALQDGSVYPHSLLSSSSPPWWGIMTITKPSGWWRLCRKQVEKDFKGCSELGLPEVLQSLTMFNICGFFFTDFRTSSLFHPGTHPPTVGSRDRHRLTDGLADSSNWGPLFLQMNTWRVYIITYYISI